MIGLNVSDLVGGGIDAATHDSYLANYHARDKRDRTSTTLGRQRVLYAKRKDGSEFQCIVGINAIADETLEEDMLIGYIRCLEMGNDPSPAAAANSGCPVKKETAVSGGCPVKHEIAASNGCPVKKNVTASSGCPVTKAKDQLADAAELVEGKNTELSLLATKTVDGSSSSQTSLQIAISKQRTSDLLGEDMDMLMDDSASGMGETAEGSTSFSSTGSNNSSGAAATSVSAATN